MSQISYLIAVGIRGPIVEGDYVVDRYRISVSYPTTVNVGLPSPLELPKSKSTLFVVNWQDNDRDKEKLLGSSFHRHLVIYKALAAINEVLLAFKMVRVGHADGTGLRTIGLDDTLFHFALVDDKPAGNLNVRLKMYGRDYDWAKSAEQDQDDPHGSTKLAIPHIGTGTFPVARRYVRCFELLEHGFYTEALIVAFSILDDMVQQMLHKLLEQQGMASITDRQELVRGIKENRLRIFLGSLLKLVGGKSLQEMWPASDKAVTWLNKKRNEIAHGGATADHAAAATAIFACIKTLVTLHQNRMIDAEFPVEIFRHAKITAAWTENPPDWVPSGQLAESMDFDS